MQKKLLSTIGVGMACLVLGTISPTNVDAKKKEPTPTTATTDNKKTDTKDKEAEKVVEPAELVKTTEIEQPLPYHMKSGYAYTSSQLTHTLGSAKDLANTTWYTYKKAVIDRSAQGSGNSVFYYVKSGNGQQSAWIWHGNLEGISEGNFEIGMKNSDYFKNQNIITMGDSITRGYDGEENLDGMGYPDWLSRYLNTKVYNYGYNGAYLVSDEYAYTDGDLTATVNKHNFKNYNVATIAYGTNDYGHTDGGLTAIQDTLRQNIRKMKSENKDLIIYGFLPTTRFDNNENSDNVIGKGGYTINDLRDAEAAVYKEFNIPYLDWREVDPGLITTANRKDRLWDWRLHPCAKTYQLMARDIAKFMIDNYPDDKKPDTETTKANKKTTSKTTKKTTKTTTKKVVTTKKATTKDTK
ncbi:SGNH/GDSL hydrolase family protein [Lentilactobacillus sp. Marseille-Q4993]|uniref:SGNH/GDSL hydrolase family protein n=1 Tax=Lentilactobacillus sp. Marseille-Q4993 TaxID=3039492 RepID=UPI0024BD0BCB|nr:SGNH/GDSL hydrolase family protein [Lentilactobacillus sp. Marseille-Q4993]